MTGIEGWYDSRSECVTFFATLSIYKKPAILVTHPHQPTGLSVNDSFLFDLIPPLWLDFVPTGAKERQGEGTFARDQRVKFQAPL